MHWAACLDPDDAAALAGLRSHAGVHALEVEGQLWVRGLEWNPDLDRELRKLPAGGRYEVLKTGQLRSFGARVPQGRLPVGGWKPLVELLKIVLPTAALPGEVSTKVALSLVRSATEERATILLTDVEQWRAFASRAPEIRLAALVFAMDEEGRVLVRGHPLPSMPGERFVDRQGVAVPAGWHWSPAVAPAVVRRLFGSAGEDLILWQRDGRVQQLPREQFVPATRSAARESAAEMVEVADGGL